MEKKLKTILKRYWDEMLWDEKFSAGCILIAVVCTAINIGLRLTSCR